jgi:polysaccharide biosynthesis protein PslH
MRQSGALTANRPAALLLSPEPPYPVSGGGGLRTASLLHYLAREYAVDLIVFRQPGAPDPAAAIPKSLVRRTYVLELAANTRHFAARVCRNAVRAVRRVPPLVDRFAGFGSQIAAAVEEKRYQIGIIEHSWCAPYAGLLMAVCDRTVLDLHNIESLLHRRCAATEGRAAGWLHACFAAASRELEGEWLPRFSEVLVPSAADAGAARVIAPGANVRVYPNAIPAVPRPTLENREAVVFSGNWDYHPNRTGVRYFRRRVWPQLRERWPELRWRLVGKNPQAVLPWISDDPRIEASGPVDDAVLEIARCRVAVVPLLAGSGTRLKILEAWAAGVPVVSTTIGAEGLPARDGEHLLLADNHTEFAAAVSRLLADPGLRQRLGNAGRCLLEKEFTWETAWKSLDF